MCHVSTVYTYTWYAVSIHDHKLPTIVRVHHVWWIPIFLEETSDTPKALICLRVTFDERSDRRFRRCCEKMGLPVLEHHIARWFAENQVSSVQNPGRFIVIYIYVYIYVYMYIGEYHNPLTGNLYQPTSIKGRHRVLEHYSSGFNGCTVLKRGDFVAFFVQHFDTLFEWI